MTMSTEDGNSMNSEQPLLNNVSSCAKLVEVDPLHCIVAAMSTGSDTGHFYDVCELWSEDSVQYVNGSMSELGFMAPDQFMNPESAAQHLGIESELLHDPWIMNQLSKIMVPVELASESQGPVQLVSKAMRLTIFSSEQCDSGSMADVGSPGPEVAMDSAGPLDSFPAGCVIGPKHASTSDSSLKSGFVSRPETPPFSQVLRQNSGLDPLQELLYNLGDCSTRSSKHVPMGRANLVGPVSCPEQASDLQRTMSNGVVSQPKIPLVSKGLSQKRRQHKEANDRKLLMGKKNRMDIKDRISILRGLIPGGERLRGIQMWDAAINYVKLLQLNQLCEVPTAPSESSYPAGA